MSDTAKSPSLELLMADSGWLVALARRLVRDQAEAEDVVQEAWIAALRRPPARDFDLRGWLATVVRRTALQRRRSQLRRLDREVRSAEGERLPAAAELAAEADAQATVARAVVELPEAERELVLLHYYRGVSVSAIARDRGEARSTVRDRLAAAHARLRRRLDAEHGGDGRSWVVLLLPLAERGEVPVATTAGAATLAAIAVSKLPLLAALSLAALAASLLVDRDREAEGLGPVDGGAATVVVAGGSPVGAPPRAAVQSPPLEDSVEAAGVRVSAPAQAAELEPPQLVVRLVDQSGRTVGAESRLELRGPGGEELVPAATGVGEYALRGLVPGAYELVADAAGFRTGWDEVELTAQPRGAPIELELEPSRVVEVCVRHLNTDAAALAQFEEQLASPFGRLAVAAFHERPSSLTARELGVELATRNAVRTFRDAPLGRTPSDDHLLWIDVVADPPHWLVLANHGQELDARWLDAGADRLLFEVDAAVVAEGLGRLRGRLVDGDGGDPVSGWTFLSLGGNGFQSTLGDDGRFDFGELAPGPYEILIGSGSNVLPAREIVVEPGQVLDLGDIGVGGAVPVDGRLVDEAGRGVEGSLRVWTVASSGIERDSVVWGTRPDGSFRIARPPALQAVTAQYDDPERGRLVSAPVVVDTREGTPADLRIVVSSPATLTVAPPALRWEDVHIAVFTVDGDLPVVEGRFHADEPRTFPVAPGTYRLVARRRAGELLAERLVTVPTDGVELSL